MEVLILVIGFSLIIWSLVMIIRMVWASPNVIFDFEDGTCEFDIESTGYYAIGLLGAGYVERIKQVKVQVQSDSGTLEVKSYNMAPRVPKGMKTAIGCWYFVAEGQGHYRLSLSNLNSVEAKKSMLMSKRAFESPLDKHELNIIVYKTIKPVYQTLAFVGIVVGAFILLTQLLPNS